MKEITLSVIFEGRGLEGEETEGEETEKEEGGNMNKSDNLLGLCGP